MIVLLKNFKINTCKCKELIHENNESKSDFLKK